MDDQSLNGELGSIIETLAADAASRPKLMHLDRVHLPNRDAVAAFLDRMRRLLFPGYFDAEVVTPASLAQVIAAHTRAIAQVLYPQVRCCLRYREQLPGDDDGHTPGSECVHCDQQASQIVIEFLRAVPAIRALLETDAQTAFEGDPAAHSLDETIFCYPGLYAVMVQRIAHEFYKLGVPLLPRMMTEYAHSLTGIDIHPGATIGTGFFVDHGTGVVIGETTVIGNNVKVYQGVTLGALAPAYGQMLRGQKRHPTIGDNVTIYANSTILGGDTVIGAGSVIGGNVFITTSVPPMNHVIADPPKLTYRDRRPKRMRQAEIMTDFQI